MPIEVDDKLAQDVKEKGNNMKRANWEVLDIMFGNGSYIGNNADVTPLYGVHVKGITE